MYVSGRIGILFFLEDIKMTDSNTGHTLDLPDDNRPLTEKEHEQMHQNNHAHVHIRNHGQVTVRIATEEEIKKGIRYIDADETSEHTHNHENGERTHTHTHEHTHKHDPAHTKKIINRFSRAIGHMQHIKLMVENETDCSEVLIQLAAVKSAVNNIGRELLKEHLAHCVVESAQHGESGDALDMLNTALDQFMK